MLFAILAWILSLLSTSRSLSAKQMVIPQNWTTHNQSETFAPCHEKNETRVRQTFSYILHNMLDHTFPRAGFIGRNINVEKLRGSV